MKTLWLPDSHAYIRFHDLPGSEPAVVLLHGLGSASSADFPAVSRAPGFSELRTILPDFLGFGFSDRPTDFAYSLELHAESIYSILRYLGLKDVYLFGHSMGGTIAIALAAAHPELIRRLVLAEANLDPGIGGGSKIIAAMTEGEYIAGGHDRFVQTLAEGLKRSPNDAGYVGALRRADLVAMHRSAVGLIRGTVPSQRELFFGMTIPRAFIFGELSLPDPEPDRLRAAGIEVLVVPGAGHGMMDDNPEGFGAALAQAFGL
jgi:pimeloyl-ACP methyl ester carboxylesterase